MPPHITVAEIAEALGISIGKARAMLREGRIPHLPRVGQENYIVSRAVFTRWLESGGEPAKVA